MRQPLIDGVDSKVCRICKELKSVKDFHPNKSCKLGVTGTCKPCSSVRVRGWYSANRKVRQEAANNINRTNKAKAVEHFGNKCHDCGQTYPQCVYQFHHLDPKEKDVNPSKSFSRKSEKMWAELKKCVMLCANCHMIRHYYQPNVGKEVVDATTH